MNRYSTTAICLVAAFAASACFTKPRQFSAQVRPVAALPTSAVAPERVSMRPSEGGAFGTCDTMVRQGRTGEFASTAASTGAATAAVLGSGAAVAASGTVGIGATTAGYAMTAAIPFVGIAAGLGMNRLIRRGRERGYRKHMTTCMGELGFEVVDWSRAPKKQSGTAMLVPATEAPAVAEAEAIAQVPASEVQPVSSEGEASASLVTAGPAD